MCTLYAVKYDDLRLVNNNTIFEKFDVSIWICIQTLYI